MATHRGPDATILLVDDDQAFAQALTDILHGEGYRMATAGNGAAALQHLREQGTPALILLNMAMPVMNGWAFLAELRQLPRFRAVPVVLLSGLADLHQQAAHLGIAECLPKPVDVRILLETVRRFAG